MNKLNLSAPWDIFYSELEELFKDDPEVNIEYDDDYTVRLYVDNIEKADALTALMPTEKVFGNITVKIVVIPANTTKSKLETFAAAFRGNPAVNQCISVKDFAGTDIGFVLFKNKVVQFFADNTGDINGNWSTLYENIAEEVFPEHLGVFFCTDVEK